MVKTLPIVGAGFVRAVLALLAKKGDPQTCPLEAFPDIEGSVRVDHATRRVKAGLLRAIHDGSGVLIGYERTPKAIRQRAAAANRKPVTASLDPSQASITPAEVYTYAGRQFSGGKSRTKGLTEYQREKRRMRLLSDEDIAAGIRQPARPPLEDHVERVEGKVDVFHTQRHASNPGLLAKVRARFALLNTPASELGAIQ